MKQSYTSSTKLCEGNDEPVMRTKAIRYVSKKKKEKRTKSGKSQKIKFYANQLFDTQKLKQLIKASIKEWFRIHVQVTIGGIFFEATCETNEKIYNNKQKKKRKKSSSMTFLFEKSDKSSIWEKRYSRNRKKKKNKRNKHECLILNNFSL